MTFLSVALVAAVVVYQPLKQRKLAVDDLQTCQMKNRERKE